MAINVLPILILLVGFVALMSAASPATRTMALKILGGLAVGGLLLSSFFFVQARDRAEQEESHARWVDEEAAHAHAVALGHDTLGHDTHGHAAGVGHASHARPVASTWSKLILVVVALGVVMLLAREHTRPAGIKVVLALVIAVMLWGVFSYRVRREWDWRGSPAHSTSQLEQGHGIEQVAPLPALPTPPANVAADDIASSTATPAPQPLPESPTTALQAAVVGEGRPPEPAPEIVAEREPTAPPVASEVRELTVAAEAAPVPASNPRPAWVDQPARREGDVYIVVANSGPFVTDQECAEALSGEAQKVARRVIDDLIGPGTANVVQSDHEYVRRLIDRVCKEQYNETRNTSVGPMKIMHVRMEFDDQVKADLKDRWRQALLETRLRHVSGAALWVLALIGAVYSYLKVDTATKGYYTKRLQVAAAVVILTIIVLGLSA